jgi:hypothetical protein
MKVSIFCPLKVTFRPGCLLTNNRRLSTFFSYFDVDSSFRSELMREKNDVLLVTLRSTILFKDKKIFINAWYMHSNERKYIMKVWSFSHENPLHTSILYFYVVI